MKKGTSLNTKGFALVETLIVGVFVMGIFSVIFSQFYPLVGEYEKTDDYDTVDSKYVGYWIRKMITDKGKSTIFTLNGCGGACRKITVSNCSSLFTDSTFCNNLFSKLGIKSVYLTKYNTTDFKKYAKDNLDNDRPLQEYIDYLPKYNQFACSEYRIIYQYKNNIHDTDDTTYLFGTMEVRK